MTDACGSVVSTSHAPTSLALAARRLLVLVVAAMSFLCVPSLSKQVDASTTAIEQEHKVLYGFGRNNAGQLGLGHTTDVAEPVAVDAFLSKDIHTVATGGASEDPNYDGFSLAVTAGGNLYAWGSNSHGQLGTGDMRDRITMAPIYLSSLAGNKRLSVSFASAGRAFSLAVTKEGEVFAWGESACRA